MTSKMASWRATLNISYISRILNHLPLANPAIKEMLESNENQTVHHSLRNKDRFKMAEESELSRKRNQLTELGLSHGVKKLF